MNTVVRNQVLARVGTYQELGQRVTFTPADLRAMAAADPPTLQMRRHGIRATVGLVSRLRAEGSELLGDLHDAATWVPSALESLRVEYHRPNGGPWRIQGLTVVKPPAPGVAHISAGPIRVWPEEVWTGPLPSAAVAAPSPQAKEAAMSRTIPSYSSAVEVKDFYGNVVAYQSDVSAREGLYRLDGELLYNGREVRMIDGEPAIKAAGGWQHIDSFERMGGKPEDLNVVAFDDDGLLPDEFSLLSPTERDAVRRRRAEGR